MAKTIFLIIYVCIHSFVACAAGILAFLTVFSVCGPGRPASMLTYVSGAVSFVMLCPIALPSFWLSDVLDQGWLVPASLILNSYLWGLAIWHFFKKQQNRT